ncbi:hypothetical protein KDW_40610 [Dictyobacter vulcani]|uniref:Uncharacterized protein n=1 Tax=Dictyobacter vulcani TaxID=2607529 RepID=A0A5J4KUY0_9CHLR|nr:hypothetical protein KDW_40610 [Dictyobacter vulcani]
MASLAATKSQAWKFVDELWNTPVPSGQWHYYDGMLYLLALLHDSGNFHIYAPSGSTPTPTSRSLLNAVVKDALARERYARSHYNSPRNLDKNLLAWKRKKSDAKPEKEAIFSRIQSAGSKGDIKRRKDS